VVWIDRAGRNAVTPPPRSAELDPNAR